MGKGGGDLDAFASRQSAAVSLAPQGPGCAAADLRFGARLVGSLRVAEVRDFLRQSAANVRATSLGILKLERFAHGLAEADAVEVASEELPLLIRDDANRRQWAALRRGHVADREDAIEHLAVCRLDPKEVVDDQAALFSTERASPHFFVLWSCLTPLISLSSETGASPVDQTTRPQLIVESSLVTR